MRKRIYLDFAASTPVSKEVLGFMEPFMSNVFGNPSSIHEEGRKAAEALRRARGEVAKAINASSDEIIFTGSGTESNNIAIQGVASKAIREENKDVLRIIVSSIEHSSVLNVARALEDQGIIVDYCRVNDRGILDLEHLASLVKEQTILISVMLVNNEIGSIQPIKEIKDLLKSKRKLKLDAYPLLHTDASQAPLYLPIDARNLGVDFLTLDSQKIYGPKGVGVLFKRRGLDIAPLFFGGGQEGGLRPGTENVSGITGLAKALDIAGEKRKSESERLQSMRAYFLGKIIKDIPKAVINGNESSTGQAPHIVNISVPGVEGEYLASSMDSKGIAVSSASACVSAVADVVGSYVVESLSEDKKRSASSLRFSMGRETTREDIDEAVSALKEIVSRF